MTAVEGATQTPGSPPAARQSSMDRVMAIPLRILNPLVQPILRLRIGPVPVGWWLMWAIVNAITVWRGWYALWREAPGIYAGLVSYTGAGAIGYCVLMLFVLFASDGFDGSASHRWGVTSSFGKIVDPIADKALTISTFVAMGLAMYQLSVPLAILMTIMLVPIIAIDIWISGITVAEFFGKCHPAADTSGKRKLAVLGLLSMLLLGSVWSMAAGNFEAALAFEIVAAPFAGLAVKVGNQSRKGHLLNLQARPR